MPPHCDTLDGPVVVAAKRALDEGDVRIVLPFAPKTAEAEITAAFERTARVRKEGKAARDVADLWFFETVVRSIERARARPTRGSSPPGSTGGPCSRRRTRRSRRGTPRRSSAS